MKCVEEKLIHAGYEVHEASREKLIHAGYEVHEASRKGSYYEYMLGRKYMKHRVRWSGALAYFRAWRPSIERVLKVARRDTV